MTLANSPAYVLTCGKVMRDSCHSMDDYRRLSAEFMHAMRPEELSPWAKALFDRAEGLEVKEIPPRPTGPFPPAMP